MKDSVDEANKLHVTATPSFFVNGKFIASGDHLDTLEMVVNNL